MAVVAATVSKLTARRALAEIVVGPDMRTSGYRTYTAASGTTTTAVISALSGIGADYVLALPWCVNNTDLTVPFEFRRATDLSGTTVTFANAFGAAVATDDELDFFSYRPSIYTTALNRAIPAVWPGIYRYLNSHLIANGSRKEGGGSLYSLPRSMRRVSRVVQSGSLSLRDLFDRVASTTTLGDGWAAASGDTYGVIGEELYCVSDVDGDYVTRSEKIKNGVIEFQVRGVLAHNVNYRTFALMFRHAEDYAGALDHNNYLVVRLLSATAAASGGVVDLRKVDGGTESSLTTAAVTTTNAVNYTVRVEWIGARIRVWIDDIQLIDFALTGANAKFIDNAGRWGFRNDLGGSPGANTTTTAGRIANLYAFASNAAIPWHDWRANADEETIQIPAISTLSPSGLLSIEGSAPLTLFSADAAQTLVLDTTAVLEIATTDPAWQTLIQAAAVELYKILGYTDLVRAMSGDLATMRRMPQPQRMVRSAQW